MTDFNRLTIEQKAGQCFFLGFRGVSLDRETAELLDLVRPGGLVFHRRNIESFDRIADFTGSVRDRFGIPLLMAIEQEGGHLDRLRHIFGPLPSVRDAGAGIARVRATAKTIAAELRACGFNLNFSPTLDFGPGSPLASDIASVTSPAVATRLGRIVIEESARKGLLSCARHFPGMGRANADPHFVLPCVDRSQKQLLQEDIVPFRNLANALGIIMVGHAHYPGLGDPQGTPASLSSRVVDLLRTRLSYGGVIVTADLAMGAIVRGGLTPDTFLEAFLAGNDMILFSETTPLVADAFHALVRTVRSSRSARTRLDQAVNRILTLKDRIPLPSLQFRSNVHARILRQIDKLRRTDAAAAIPDVVVTP